MACIVISLPLLLYSSSKCTTTGTKRGPSNNAQCKTERTLFNLNAGSSQEGLINYDNLNWSNTNVSSDYKLGNNGMFIYSKNTRKPQSGQSAEFNVFPGTDFNPVDISGKNL